MTWTAPFFRAAAIVALLIVIRYTLRLEGRRQGLILVAYLAVMGTLREWTVARLSAAIDQPVAYTPDGSFGQIGRINVVVVADKATIHNFVLERESPSHFEKTLTGVGFQGTKTATIKLTKGKWKYYCRPHESSMFGKFTVT